MATYAEYLKSQGASEEDIKLLDTPVARRIWEHTERRIVEIAKERDDAKAGATAYEERANAWYDEQKNNLSSAKAAAATAAAEAARYRAALLTAHKQGMIDIAKDLGFKPEELEGAAPPTPPNTPPSSGNGGFDPNKYFTREEILTIANGEGEAIAVVADIAGEHATLFPGQRLNFRQLRQEAMAAKKSVEQHWMDKYKVAEAREARAKADKEAHEKSIRDDERKKVETELASKWANPETRPPVTSSSPFAPRPAGNTRSGKQPWETGENFENSLANDRVTRATQKVLQNVH